MSQNDNPIEQRDEPWCIMHAIDGPFDHRLVVFSERQTRLPSNKPPGQ